jgi:hypothetical protein
VGGLGIDAKEGERRRESQIIFKKSFVEFLDGGGRNSS